MLPPSPLLSRMSCKTQFLFMTEVVKRNIEELLQKAGADDLNLKSIPNFKINSQASATDCAAHAGGMCLLQLILEQSVTAQFPLKLGQISTASSCDIPQS